MQFIELRSFFIFFFFGVLIFLNAEAAPQAVSKASASKSASDSLSSSTSTPSRSKEIVIRDQAVLSKPQSSKSIELSGQNLKARPTVEAALQSQSSLQVVPTPLRGANLSLNGLSGERVAIYSDRDPVLGRTDGALDVRSLFLNTAETVNVYQGLDSLSFGSQNIAGTVQLETPWRIENRIEMRGGAGNAGRTLLGAKIGRVLPSKQNLLISADLFRSDSMRKNAASTTTLTDATAKLSLGTVLVQPQITKIAGKSVDVKVGGEGIHDQSAGLLANEKNVNTQRRVHAFLEVKRSQSVFHSSFSEYRKNYEMFGASGQVRKRDQLKHRQFRFGPELNENIRDWTLFTGLQTEINSIEATRIPKGKVTQSSVGVYSGVRKHLNETVSLGAGSRYDSGPRFFSPRMEVQAATSTVNSVNIKSVLETGMAYREPAAIERYLNFSNSALGYRVLGNPELKAERAWVSGFRNEFRTQRWTVSENIYFARLFRAISFVNQTGALGDEEDGVLSMTYGNIGRVQTLSSETRAQFEFIPFWFFTTSYTRLWGKNFNSGGQLFLQPLNRASFALERKSERGLSGSLWGVWTGRQGYFDLNRNQRIDSSEWTGAFWSLSTECSYSFYSSWLLSEMRVFGRVDNVMDYIKEESFPREPRVFLAGVSFSL